MTNEKGFDIIAKSSGDDADVGYAVANACESLKAVADRVTVDARENALAAVIEEIDRI